MKISGIFIFSFVVDIVVFAFCLFYKSDLFLLNTQVAYLSASIVIFITYSTYKSSILKNANIYSESIKNKTKKNNKNKKVSYKNIRKIFRGQNFLSYVSIYRLGAYMALSFSLLYLINHQMFDAVGYMIGVSILPVSIIIFFALRFVMKRFSIGV